MAAADQGEGADRTSQGQRPNPQGQPGNDNPREANNEPTNKREKRRPETLPSAATSGGLPSEPGWMRP